MAHLGTQQLFDALLVKAKGILGGAAAHGVAQLRGPSSPARGDALQAVKVAPGQSALDDADNAVGDDDKPVAEEHHERRQTHERRQHDVKVGKGRGRLGVGWGAG